MQDNCSPNTTYTILSPKPYIFIIDINSTFIKRYIITSSPSIIKIRTFNKPLKGIRCNLRLLYIKIRKKEW